MIDLTNIRKGFDGVEVLKGISTSFEPGKINLVIGASGHGKSVLMKCMVGLLEADHGHVFYDNRDFTELNFKEVRAVRREIGMLFQSTALFNSLSVQDNVDFPLKMFTTMTPEERLDRVNFCLERVQMDGSNHKFPAEISGGMKKRVGIARAIALNTKYLFCDEPNSGLDPITSRVIDQLIKDITQEFDITTMINTHDMKTVFEIGDKINFIYYGENWWEGTKEELIKSDNKELKTFFEASYFK
jgi:phospholipid/cholesterol/gamma-HCH transport system ATP-binding protein